MRKIETGGGGWGGGVPRNFACLSDFGQFLAYLREKSPKRTRICVFRNAKSQVSRVLRIWILCIETSQFCVTKCHLVAVTRTDLRSKVARREGSPELMMRLMTCENVTKFELFFGRDRSRTWNHLSHLDHLFEPFCLGISIFGSQNGPDGRTNGHT